MAKKNSGLKVITYKPTAEKMNSDRIEEEMRKNKKREEEERYAAAMAQQGITSKSSAAERTVVDRMLRQRAAEEPALRQAEVIRTFQNAGQNATTVNKGTDFQRNALQDILDQVDKKISLQQAKINGQGRKKDDPAVLKEEYAKLLESRQNVQDKLYQVPETPQIGMLPNDRITLDGGRAAYTEEEENQIRKIQGRIESGMSKFSDIPYVYDPQVKKDIHNLNGMAVTDEDSYARWLRQGANAGLYNDETSKMYKEYAYYKLMPSEYNTREYSAYIRGGIEQGIFDGGSDISMMSTQKLLADIDALKNRRKEQEENEKNMDSLEGELYDIDQQLGAYDELGNKGLLDPLTQEWHKGKPADYDEWGTRGQGDDKELKYYYDSLLYDAVHGEGAYNQVYETGTDEDFDRMDEEIQEMWRRMEDGTIGEMKPKTLGEREAELRDITTSSTGDIDRQIALREEELRRRNEQKEYENSTAGAEYDMGADDLSYEAALSHIHGLQTGGLDMYEYATDPETLYVLVNEAAMTEADTPINGNVITQGANLYQAEKEYRKYAHMTPKMVETFNGLYLEDKEKAMAYLKTLEPYLNAMQSQYVQGFRERAAGGNLGALYGAETILTQPVAGVKGTVGTILALLGNENARDKYSGFYKEVIRNQQIRGARAGAWGDFFANTFGEQYRGAGEWLNGVTYSIADNLMAMATAKAGGTVFNYDMASDTATRVVQFVMSSEATASAMADALDKGMDPTEAAIRSIGQGLIEAVTEKYSIEALLKPDVKEMLGNFGAIMKFLGKNTIAEGMEEGASDILGTVWDEMLSSMYGHESELTAEYNQLVAQGMDPTDASKQVWNNWMTKMGSDIAAGALSGMIMSGGRVAMNTFNQIQAGRNVRNVNNTVGTQTGADQLIAAARGMDEGTVSRQMAEEMYEAAKQGRKASTRQVGQLVQNMQLESSEQVAQIAEDTVDRMVREDLKGKGVEVEIVDQVAPIITQAAISGDTRGIDEKDIQLLAQDKRVVDTFKDVMSDTGKMATHVAVAQEAAEPLSVRETVDTLMQGGSMEDTGSPVTHDAVESEARATANVATAEEIAEAQGRTTNTGLDAVFDGQIVQVIGLKDGQLQLKTADGTTTADIGDVVAAGTQLGTVIDFIKTTGVIDDAAASAMITGIKGNAKLSGAKYMAEAMNVYLEARTGGTYDTAALSEETVNAIRKAAEKWTGVEKENRLQKGENQQQVTPGKGTTTFGGVKYGTEAWKGKIKDLSSMQREQANVLAEIIRITGNEMELINDEKNDAVFGWEEDSGKITVNLAAKDSSGASMNRSLLTIAGHELTHWLEQNSPEAYDQLRQYIFDRLRSGGADIGTLVMRKIDQYRSIKGQENISIEGAMAELVADGCDQVLLNRKLAQELQAEYKGLAGKIRKYAQGFIDRWTKAAKVQSSSATSRALMRQGEEVMDQIAQNWNIARKEAAGQLKTAAEAKTGTAAQMSVREDSEGRQLTQEQAEYFKESKAVDSKGRLKVLYHGTPSAGFTVFGRSDAEGYFFTDDIDVARSYSDSDKVFAPDRNDDLDDMVDYSSPEMATKSNYGVYLNLKNPKVINGRMSMWNAVVDSEGGNMKSWSELTPRQRFDIADNMGLTLSEAENRGVFGEYGEFEAAVYDLNTMKIRDAMSTREWVEKAAEEGNDGVIFKNIQDEGPYSGGMPWVSTVYVAFDPEQIKSINNKAPTSNPDIRYSVAEEQDILADESVHPASSQFSVRQIAESTSLEMIPGDNSLTLYMEDPNGKTVKGLDENKKWVKVDGVKVKITPEMIRETPVGMLIDMGLSNKVVKDGMTQKETARKMFADLMNMCARYRENNLIWEIAGSEFAETFSALKKNSDPQYRNTVDFGTICSKTQAIVDVLSETMKRRIADTRAWNEAHPGEKEKVFDGLTREDIMMVYNKTHNANLSVPCPVCYVFSRWMGVPSLLGQMNRYQHRFVATVKDEGGRTKYDANGDAVIDWEKTSENANQYIKDALKRYGSKDAITKKKTNLQNKINKRADSLPDLQKKLAELKKESKRTDLTDKQKTKISENIRKAQAAVDNNIKDTDRFTKELEDVEAYNWVTQALCVQHNEGNRQVNDLDENGNYIVDRTFRMTPEEILFDLNRTGEFAGYVKNWRYRTTRGAGMGKAIMPYSGASIGDIVNGDSKRWTSEQNPFRMMDRKAAERAFENAKERVRKQNLVGGQRFQSTSDFRPEWGLDYVMSFLEMQALGSKVQMYTKVQEAVDFLGSIGADLNESIMASGNGWHIATAEEMRRAQTDRELRSRMGVTYDENGKEHTYVMDFSDVTGMDYNTAKENTKRFNSVQMILVGMNDIHIRLALQNEDIDFVIPWHSSGNSKDVLQTLVRSVDETLTESNDYTKAQEDTKKKKRTAKQIALWDARVKLLQEGAKKLTDAEIRTLESNPFTKNLYRRFGVKGVDDDCYGVTLPKDQAEKIFPYEYWDKTSTRKNAYVNGQRFVQYCEALGLNPRFGMFKNEAGYWKLLIDRKMFDNNILNKDGSVKEYGKYREQQVVDVTKAEIGQLPTSTTARYGGKYAAEEDAAIESSMAALRQKYDVELAYNPYAEEEKAPAEKQTKKAQKQLSVREMDDEYMAAVDSGDMEEAQRIVDDAAKEAGYTIRAAHGSDAAERFNVFKPGARGEMWFASSNGTAYNDRPQMYDVYLKMSNPYETTEWVGPETNFDPQQAVENGRHGGHDGAIVHFRINDYDAAEKAAEMVGKIFPDMLADNDFGNNFTFLPGEDIRKDTMKQGETLAEYIRRGMKEDLYDWYVVYNSEQIKYADTVTYDDDGNVIPLSERFNRENPDIRYSIRDEGDMDVQNWMMTIKPEDLRTEQERNMLKQYQNTRVAAELARMSVSDKRNRIRALERKMREKGSNVADREALRKLNIQYDEAMKKLNREQERLVKITTDKGYAALMYREHEKMDRLVNGKTVKQVQQSVEALTAAVQRAQKGIEQREARIRAMANTEAVKQIQALLTGGQLDTMAAWLRKTYQSSMNKQELMAEMSAMRLKMAQGEDVTADAEALAWKLLYGIHYTQDDVLAAMRGMTLTLGPNQVKEIYGSGMTMKELRSRLAGTGIKVVQGEKSGLDRSWSDLRKDTNNALPETVNEGDQVKTILDLVENRREQAMRYGVNKYGGNIKDVTNDVLAATAAVNMAQPKDPQAMAVLRRMRTLITKMAGTMTESTGDLAEARAMLGEIVQHGKLASDMSKAMQQNVEDAIRYNNALVEQSEAVTWAGERLKLINQMRDKHTQEMLAEQEKWRSRIAKDKATRQKMADNMEIRKKINRNVTRVRAMLVNETDQKHVTEHMKGLAREMLGMIVKNDLAGRKITGISREDLGETARLLAAWEAQDGKFDISDLKMIEDEEAQAMVADALADIEDGIAEYNSVTSGKGVEENLATFGEALDKIAKAVAVIKGVIDAENSVAFLDRKIAVTDAAVDVMNGFPPKGGRGELKGRGAKAVNAVNRGVVYGNTTPVYFFKNLNNQGVTNLWNGMQQAENRNGLLMQGAAAWMDQLAKDTHYGDWDHEKKYDVTLNGATVKMNIEQIMAVLATWEREQRVGPEYSSHMERGGIYLQDDDGETGKLHREQKPQRAHRVKAADIAKMQALLTDEQKRYMNAVVEYLSSDMSRLGNEASMRMYGIRKYKEEYYYPMKIWDGVKSARSDKGISGTDDNRIAHQGWSKRRKINAQNALVIGNFTDVAVKHMTEMINYATFAPEIENMNKVLNWQYIEEEMEEGPEGRPEVFENRRNIRVMFQENYGKEALRYLEEFMKDLQGGAVQDQRKTLRDRALSIFKKNAVAGSLSVALQQPLSYIRAAMLINPKYLTAALIPGSGKDSFIERMKYSGVSVIKQMGRFDMNFGRSAAEFIAPEVNKKGVRGVLSKAAEATTAAPEKMDALTWNRMWTAVKLEQQALNPGMDHKSDEFMQKVAERFNEVMRKTQVYDSILTKSSNMRSQNLSMKILTSFMAEPTLSLNVLADAVQNVKQKGGKVYLARAGATFLLSAVLQAFVKGLIGSGRTPDEKKTWAENFLYKWQQNLMSEANPFSLIPGYGDLIELLKNGELKDDAMGALGKIKSIITTAQNMFNPEKSKGPWRDIEDSAGQLVQLFTNVPAKNLMRDLRAMYNWVSGAKYADRETSAAVLKQQAAAAFHNGDNLLGVLNEYLGESGYSTTNKGYFKRLYNAKQAGNTAKEDEIREYMTLAKGTKKTTIDSGLRSVAEERMAPAEATGWMIDNGLLSSTGTITDQYKKGDITRDEAKSLYKAADSKLTDNDIWWKLDRIDWYRETGENETGYYYRLEAAVNANKAADIQKAVDDLLKHGITKEKIKNKMSDWKAAYLAADSAGRIKIRDAIQKAYKAAGYTAADADKTIKNWTKK